MLHSVLFVATIPERDDQNRWQNVLNNLPPQMRSPTVAIERLAENVWLLRLSGSLAPLGHLISRCEQFGIVYRILPFDGEPQWLPGDPSPRPTPATGPGQQ